jgi:hypothetical protein
MRPGDLVALVSRSAESDWRFADVKGVYYHFDYVGDPRNYKWINTIQLEKTVEQVGSFCDTN